MAKEKSTKRSGGKKLSPYNKFMKTELPKVKAEDPSISHKDAFKVAAGRWKASAENPANKKESKEVKESKEPKESKESKTEEETKE
ncbi:hypothetical protein K493DRAFT_321197 [Basidiobolus meristosporus CBS 931.73]|uniref:YABBY protein C-terminal domain-containing protein n=1 Tax=Basidiobolus meristosporus CBS 931.73 TaxID=1314790 RepID=A0A1Y1WYD8_9FUNG|nr:hypothetical protein K493DRAFT_321197 [Basidiobolus meristosporus CBS 931.73]|eukprot:ORX78561.1 hypothetical protein K493DRAFT_321197 [Basidiobolus meristosporus CBS 931.73]